MFRLRKNSKSQRVQQLILDEDYEFHVAIHVEDRAYHAGVVDGLSRALKVFAPEAIPMVPVSIEYYEDTEPEAVYLSNHKNVVDYELRREEEFDRANAKLVADELL